MYTHFFDNKINKDNVNELIDRLYDKDEIELFFSTQGGQTPSMKVLLHFLNSRHEKIKVIITDSLASAGTLLLTDFKGKIEFRDLDFILFHVFDRERYPIRKTWGDFNDIIQKQDYEGNLKLAKKFRKLGLTKKEIKQFLRGQDVILYKDRFKKLNIN